MRAVGSTYRDPLDEIWIGAARRIGFTIARSGEVYASTDGQGRISVATPELFDADDCLAQMILHELCHAMVEGEAAWRRPDWGLDNQTARDEVREVACLRLQAALLAPHGLRTVLAATTDHRAIYDALPADPLSGAGEAVVAARLGWQRAQRAPFAPHLQQALLISGNIARAVAELAAPDALLARALPAADVHRNGLPLHVEPRTCGDCAWRVGGRGKSSGCRQVDGVRVTAETVACERWEAALDCQTCGACCREAYHSVEVHWRDPAVAKHPELIVRRETYLEVLRDGDHCAALDQVDGRYGCRIYADRPRTCRDFTLASAHCRDARRKVGLSR